MQDKFEVPKGDFKLEDLKGVDNPFFNVDKF